MKRDKAIPLRISEDEAALIQAIQNKTGYASHSEVLRQGLRALAEREGVKIKAPKK